VDRYGRQSHARFIEIPNLFRAAQYNY
jgi:hypothetical protein